MSNLQISEQLSQSKIVEITNFEIIYNLIKLASDKLVSQGLDQWDGYYTPVKIREKLSKGKFLGLFLGNELIVIIHISENYPDFLTNNSLGENGESVDFTMRYSQDSALNFWFISAFAVHPQFQGKGFARMFLEKLIELAKEANIGYLRLDCRETGYEWLSEFYKRHGFKVVGRIIEKNEPDYLLMEKGLVECF